MSLLGVIVQVEDDDDPQIVTGAAFRERRQELLEEHQAHDTHWEVACPWVRVATRACTANRCEICRVILPQNTLHIRVQLAYDEFYGDHYCWPCALEKFGPDAAEEAVTPDDEVSQLMRPSHSHGRGCIRRRVDGGHEAPQG